MASPGLAAARPVCRRPGRADDLDRRVLNMEKKRVAVIEKVQPSVVAVARTGGGSGVLISDDGYALTNFHVVAADRPRPCKCGLRRRRPLRRRPRRPGQGRRRGPHQAAAQEGGQASSRSPHWATATRSQAGDWSLAMGNPFLLATDFTPTVTFGLVSGVHRYQYPAGSAARVHRLHPDRHVDQPRQLRRAALQHEGRADRHQRPRLVREARPGQLGRRLRHLDQPDQELPGPPAGRPRHRPRHARRRRRRRESEDGDLPQDGRQADPRGVATPSAAGCDVGDELSRSPAGR